ncbi:class F sortase [Candidatus Parcubacteria bacterium]|nr:class F sortase [Candidatus Parcubacteria bacterium]
MPEKLFSRSLVRYFALAAGFFVILVGAADVMSRLSTYVADGKLLAFGPAIAITDPNIISQTGLSSTSSVPFVPTHLKVVSLGIDANVVPVKNKADGSMDTPKKFNEIAWYELGSRVGAPGNAVFAGHVNNALTTSGVFSHLSQMQKGDKIEIGGVGSARTYVVTTVTNYPVDSAPLETIFAKQGPSQVVLITCDGEWDPKMKEFRSRLVVFAKPLN